MANDEHVRRLLDEGVEAWNAWREAEPNVWPDLRNANLSYSNLSYAHLQDAYLIEADLKGVHLREANLQNANLSYSNLSSADLSSADLSSADFSSAHLWNANLSSANLIGAHLSSAHLIEANLKGVHLRSANLSSANLRSADLRNAHLRSANLNYANLNYANLIGARLRNAHLRSANLIGAHLQEADFSYADLRNADLTRAYINYQTNFENVFVNGETKGLSPWIFNPERYIIREIEFPPEYRQAGIGIMHYFDEVLRQKYPDIPATVQITQEELTVRMTIETDDGHREIVEKTLEEYGLVIADKMVPEAFLNDQYERMGLEYKLEMTKMELRLTHQLHEAVKLQQDQRIGSLESDIAHLRNQQNRAPTSDELLREVRGLVGQALLPVRSTQLAQLFRDHLALAPDDEIRNTLARIQSIVLSIMERHEAHKAELTELTNYMRRIDEQDPSYWSNLKTELLVFFTGASAGVGGNFLTDGIKDLIEIIKMIPG